MNRLTLSRSTAVDTELCVKNAGGNRYNLVIMAAVRAKELAAQHKSKKNKTHGYPIISALLDFQEGKIGPEYLKRV